MTKAVFDAIPRITVKGEALYQLAAGKAGTYEQAVLRLAADAVDRETISIGTESFELAVINTAVTGTSLNLDNTSSANVTETLVAHGLAVGAVLLCGSEFLKVVAVPTVDTVELKRGWAGSTVASHADASAFKKAAATALTAGKITLPLLATLTPAVVGPLLATGMAALSTQGFTFTYASNALTIWREANGKHETLAETLTGANNGWSAAATFGGLQKGDGSHAVAQRVPTAVDVALGVMAFKFAFTPTFVRVTVVDSASLAVVAWNGAYAVSGGVVTVDNSSTTDWTASHTVVVEAFA